MNSKSNQFFSNIPILLLCLLFLSPAISARVIYVSPDGVPDGTGASWVSAFTTITSGLTAATSDDEIWVRSATYTESIEMKEGISLYGGFAGNETNLEERNWLAFKTVIDATGLNQSVVIGANAVILDGFTVTGGSSVDGGGVYCDASSPVLTNCIITSNSAKQGGGVYCIDSSPTLTNCIIVNNTGIYGGGVYCIDSSPLLTNCTLAENWANKEGSGINCEYQSSPTLINCLLWNRGQEVYVDEEGSPSIQYSCIQGGWPGEGNIEGNPFFMDAASGDYHLSEGSSCIDRGLVSAAPSEDLEGNPRPGDDGLVDMGAYESPATWQPGPANHTQTRWYVRAESPDGGDGTSWATAWPSITSALRVAGTSDEVWIQEGIYHEMVVLEVGVALYGGFAGNEANLEERDWQANKTIIDVTRLNRSVVIGADYAVIDGFTLTGGSADGGGGVYCNKSSPTLKNCTISENSSRYYGGGLYCYGSSPTLANCIISGNSSEYYGGGVYCNDSFPVLEDCTISGNSSEYYGGGMSCNDSSPSLFDCTLSNNSAEYKGGGLYCEDFAPTLSNCIIAGNSAKQGGGVYDCWYSSLTLANCTISDNVSEYDGGGMYCYFSSPVLTNCTVAGNSSLNSGGGMYCYYYSPILTNCILTGNSASDSGGGLYGYYSSPTLTNCTITGNSALSGGVYLYYDYEDDFSFPILTNCILWNSGAEIIEASANRASVTYSCIEDGWEGEGNISSDPLFIDVAGGDSHLQEDSPCIDAGNPSAVYNDGCLPPGLGSVRNDMGAYGGPENCENNPASPTPTPVFTPVPFSGWLIR